MFVGERLADLRKDKGLQQKELAAILGVSERSVSLYERELSSPHDDVKLKIAKYFNVSLDYLLGLINAELSLDRKYDFILPPTLPVEAHDEMLRFIGYLKHKYKSNSDIP